MDTMYFLRITADPDSKQDKAKNGVNMAKLLYSDGRDPAQLDSLIEENFWDETDKNENLINYITAKDNDFHQNYIMVMEVAEWSREMVSDCIKSELISKDIVFILTEYLKIGLW